MSGEWCNSRQLPQANGGCYGAAGCCSRQMEAAVAGKWKLLRRRRLLSRDKSGCGRVSTKLDRAFRRLLPQDVEEVLHLIFVFLLLINMISLDPYMSLRFLMEISE
ncbi:hypothetical protein F2Q68_00019119 [Brassica cretica]|uniref:Uncharacterized protein n=1 Tax=Brassica cretica TaxID=69181 RepID=A0A8S9FSH3_BRACR|nr:hypothetical protein F2Q68_00019119 [Brassica cretica]